MKPLYKKVLAALGVILLLSAAGGAYALNRMLPGEIAVPPPPEHNATVVSPDAMPDDARAELLWDKWGVPHIFARNDESAFRAYGYAQAHSHGNLLLELYAQARGRSAAVYGDSHLPWDRMALTLDIPARGQAWYEAQSPTFARNLDAFAQGINRYAAENPEALSAEARAVLPVSGSDVVAHYVRILTLFQQGCLETLFPELNYFNDPILEGTQLEGLLGSNGWAIAPQRAAEGDAMLLANPHLLWGGWNIWYEAHIATPEMDAYGANLVGFPVLNVAFNDYLGWTHTVNKIDTCDVYELTPTTGGDAYVLDGEAVPFDVRNESIQVLQEDGTVTTERVELRESVHGPVVEVDGQLLAGRYAFYQIPTPGALEQWWDMAHATDYEEFDAALSRLQIPMMTVIYADRDGNVLSLFGGQVPVRPEGDFHFWLETVPGDRSDLIWTDILDYEELPRMENPRTGFVQNSNSAPWWTGGPDMLDPADFPAYVSDPDYVNLREQRGIQLLTGDASITLEELVQYKHDTYALLTERVLDELIAAAREAGSDEAVAAAEILARWDRRYDADSRGAMLFYAWGMTWIQQEGTSEFAVDWDNERPFDTPRGLADPEQAVEILIDAYQQLRPIPLLPQADLTDREWGFLARFRYGDVDLPGNGGSGVLGVFRVIEYVPTESGYMTPLVGDTYVAAVQFDEEGPRARVINTYGNSSQPGSPHMGDQLWLAMEQEMRPAWRDRGEIRQHLAGYVIFE